jgi:hypothetical protein
VQFCAFSKQTTHTDAILLLNSPHPVAIPIVYLPEAVSWDYKGARHGEHGVVLRVVMNVRRYLIKV